MLFATASAGAALGATPVGSEFQVNTYTTGFQYSASVAADAAGNFVVVWNSAGSSGTDTDYSSVQAQRYDASGSALGAEFQVNTYTTAWEWSPSVAIDADGDFVVVWDSGGSWGSDTDNSSVQGQRYDASGNSVGAQFQVSSYTTNRQSLPSVAVGANGDFVVVWESYGSAGSDSSSYSIQGQRYTSQAQLVPSLAPPGAIGLGLLLFSIAAVGLRRRLSSRS